MKENCNCKYCLNKVNEYFCINCSNNFNKCECAYEFFHKNYGDLPEMGMALCPKCHPDTWQPNPNNFKFNMFRKIIKDIEKKTANKNLAV